MSTNSTQPRQPKGRPVGGQFAAKSNPEADVTLGGAPLKEVGRGQWEVTNTTSRELSTDGIDGGLHFRRIEIVPGGRADARAHAGAAARLMADSTGATYEDLIASLRDQEGDHVTVLTQSPRAKSVEATEGTVTVQDGGRVGLLNKGSKTKGHYLSGMSGCPRVLAVKSGYGGQMALAEMYRSFENQVPAVDPVSENVLTDIPFGTNGARSDVAAVFLMDHPGFEDTQDGRGCVFFATDRDPEDVVNGYFVAPAGSGLFSESGSFTTRQLQQWTGRVRDYRPDALDFKVAMKLADWAETQGSMLSVYEAIREASS